MQIPLSIFSMPLTLAVGVLQSSLLVSASALIIITVSYLNTCSFELLGRLMHSSLDLVSARSLSWQTVHAQVNGFDWGIYSWSFSFWLFSYLLPFVGVSSCWLCEVELHIVYQKLFKQLAKVQPNTFRLILHACFYKLWNWNKRSVHITVQCSF